MHVAVTLAYPGYTITGTGTGGITTEQLVHVLQSAPVLSNAYLHPSSGTEDLRRQFNETWLRAKLQAAGFSDITMTAEQTPSIYPNTAPPTSDGFVHATFTSTDGTQVRGTFGPQAPLNGLPPLGKVVKIGTADFQTNGGQSYGYCNDIFVNITSPISQRRTRDRSSTWLLANAFP